jgi:hypothetical protein
VIGARSALAVRQFFGDVHGIPEEAYGLDWILVQGDARGAGQRKGDHVPVFCSLGEPARLGEALLCKVVSTGPEDQVAVVVDRPGAAGILGFCVPEVAPEPIVAVVDPLRRHPEGHQRRREPVCVVQPPDVEQPGHGFAHVRVLPLEMIDRRCVIAPTHRHAPFHGGVEKRGGGDSIHGRGTYLVTTPMSRPTRTGVPPVGARIWERLSSVGAKAPDLSG